ncbi:hypothetical protein ATO10_00820 [Actibacterium atlanticum]|uniref:Uncharacterized protein n=1 Tax=Actibacterium atlanticum TaxID=1461693 RepID=A0A058ZNU7_9RHOB|nr:hypothetical protein [Actibacterium atlanticum]KCV83259.1 hypothetical protein ATO10_00820 [Actibacterium atlanticum]
MPFEQHLSDPDLWRRICECEFPKDEFGHSFAQYLANITHWPAEKVHGVIEEYRRFAYLSAMQDHLLVGPPVIEAVWAHHRAFGDAYDKTFVPGIGLQVWEPFEGARRDRKTRVQHTRLIYEREFGAPPPNIGWQRPAVWRLGVAALIVLASSIGPVLLGVPEVLIAVLLFGGVFGAGWVAQPYFREEL